MGMELFIDLYGIWQPDSGTELPSCRQQLNLADEISHTDYHVIEEDHEVYHLTPYITQSV